MLEAEGTRARATLQSLLLTVDGYPGVWRLFRRNGSTREQPITNGRSTVGRSGRLRRATQLLYHAALSHVLQRVGA
jgi:hypothetical protein